MGGAVRRADASPPRIGLGEPVGTIQWTAESLVAVVYLAVVVGVGGYTVFRVLLAEVGPVRSSFTSFASPMVTIVAGWPLPGEVVVAHWSGFS